MTLKRFYSFWAILEPCADGEISVYFPDLPGLASGGVSEATAALKAKSGLALHLFGTDEDGDPIPEPSPKNAISLAEGEKLAKIDVDMADYYPALFPERRGGPRPNSGRPKKRPEERTGRQASRKLIVRLTDAEFVALENAAKKAKKTKSEFVRDLIPAES